MEEIRQINQNQVKFSSKIRLWFSEIWNRFDFAGLVIFLIAVIYRFAIVVELDGLDCRDKLSSGCGAPSTQSQS